MKRLNKIWLPTFFLWLAPVLTNAHSFWVKCPLSTALPQGNPTDQGGIKCKQISGRAGMATMADGTQTYIFSFGPLSDLDSIANVQAGTQSAVDLMKPFDPATAPNGAVRLSPDLDAVNVTTSDPITGTVITTTNVCMPASATTTIGFSDGGNPPQACYTGHVDPRQIMGVRILYGNMPAPMIAIDEDDECFLTLTSVGMILCPDLLDNTPCTFTVIPSLLLSMTLCRTHP